MPVQTVAVIGGGTMGSGVALSVVTSAMNCIIVDIN
ncbi:MAG TPA: 3-hydroxybutyryl-CoA dehydrogenase, partial [Phycisphaerales bacterium]|nr:3-hydroxybutyryl-CoA dehydrogenase [Phycisphaerales bacterium]